MACMDELSIPWSRVTAFVRQHTHDVRNGLNGLELETELLREIVTDPEGAASMDAIQKKLRTVTKQLKSISSLFHDPSPLLAPIPASSLMRIWHESLASLSKSPPVNWVDRLDGEEVNADFSMMAHLLRELLANASHFSPGAVLTASAFAHEGHVVFQLLEPKSEAASPSEWGQPLVTTRRGGYGLNLWTAKRNVESMGAAFTQKYDAEQRAVLSAVKFPQI